MLASLQVRYIDNQVVAHKGERFLYQKTKNAALGTAPCARLRDTSSERVCARVTHTQSVRVCSCHTHSHRACALFLHTFTACVCARLTHTQSVCVCSCDTHSSVRMR